jgi:hypothetical protein
MMKPNSQTTIDTIMVFNYCLEGVNCVNHDHGIIDTTFYFYANVGTSKTYFKVMPSEMDSSVDCRNLYKDVFGNIFYMEPEVKQEEKKEVSLNSFDTIKVGDKVYPAPTHFVPHYRTHTESVKCVNDNYDSVVDVLSLPVLVLMTISFAYRSVMNNSWTKLFKELSSV